MKSVSGCQDPSCPLDYSLGCIKEILIFDCFVCKFTDVRWSGVCLCVGRPGKLQMRQSPRTSFHITGGP
jgi:hypothetical protein